MIRPFIFLKILLLVLPGLLRAQSVSVTVNVLPPYSSYIQDYASKGNQVQIFVRNTTAVPLEVRLLGKVTGDNGVTIATPPNFRPAVPLRLGPLENRLLSRADLEGLFDVAQFVVEGFDRNQLAQGKPLPEGAYQLCLEAYDNRTSRLLSAEFPLGCSAPFGVRYVEPPILIAPLCDEAALATTPQALPFTWSPPAGVPPNQVRYTLRVVELPLEQVDPNAYIDVVNLPLSGVEVKNLPLNSFLYSPQYPKLTPGKRYAWRVQASDPTGKLVFLNDGKSPVCAFTYGKSAPVAQFDLAVVPPTLTWAGLTVTDLQLTNSDPDHFTGKGIIKLISPVKADLTVSFKEIVVRPTAFSLGQFSGTKGYGNYVVMKGTTEVKFTQGKTQGQGKFSPAPVNASDGIVIKLKTAPRTGGTAELAYRTLFLQANLPFQLDESKNAFTKNAPDGAAGTELAEVRGSLKWESPLLTGILLKPSGSKGPLAMANVGVPVPTTIEVTALKLPASTGAAPEKTGPNAPVPVIAGASNPNTLTSVPGQTLTNKPGAPQLGVGSSSATQPGQVATATNGNFNATQLAGTTANAALPDEDVLKLIDDGSLRIPFNNKYDFTLGNPQGFGLTLLPTSEFRIKDGLLWVVLNGSLAVPSGRDDLPELTVPIEQQPGLAFTVTLPETFAYRIGGRTAAEQTQTKIGGKTVTVSNLAGASGPGFQAYLRITRMNVKLADLPNADDLPFPKWVTGVTVPKPYVVFTSGADDEGTKVPIQLAKNIGFGFTTKKSPPLETADAEFKGKTKFLGFPAQFTSADLALAHTRLESGTLKGLIYIPFVGMVGKLTVPVTDKGLGDGQVSDFTNPTREMVKTPAGDVVVMVPKGGYLIHHATHGALFVLNARFRFFNNVNSTHFLRTGVKGLEVQNIGIHPTGKLYNVFDGFLGGGTNTTIAATNYAADPTGYTWAELNGLDFQVEQTKLVGEKAGGGSTCTLTLKGSLTLGEKITTEGDQTVSISFPRPNDKFKSDDPDVSLDELAAVDWQPAGDLNLGLGGKFGPSAESGDAEQEAWLTEQRAERVAKALGWSAPAATMEVAANQVIKGSFDQGPLKFDAEFTIFNDDPTYGNGFKSYWLATVREPIQSQVSTTIMAGKQQGIKYWFVEAGGKLAQGVPVFVDLEAYGFTGRFYHHMKHGGDDPNRSIDASYYVPDAGVTFGFYASAKVRSMGDQGALFWGTGSTEFQFNGWSPKSVAFRGTAYIVSAGAENTAAMINGWAQLGYDFYEKVLQGQYEANADYKVACLKVRGEIYVGKGNLIFTAGSPGAPATARLFCGNVDFLDRDISAYAAVYHTGSNVPEYLAADGFIPANQLAGAKLHALAVLLDLDSRDFVDTEAGVTVKLTNESEMVFSLKPFGAQGWLNATFDVTAFYKDYETDLLNHKESYQFLLNADPRICLSYRQNICIPVLGGIDFVVKLDNFAPSLFGNQCFEAPNDKGCEGVLNKIVDGIKKAVNAAGEFLEDVGTTVYNAVTSCFGFC